MNQATWTGTINIQFADGVKQTYSAFQTGVLGLHPLDGYTYWYGTVFIDNMYWLDRNIGATSDVAWDYVLNIGAYETGLGTLFTWDGSVQTGICPKGFRLPVDNVTGREMQYLFDNMTRSTPTGQWGVMTSNSIDEGPKWHYFASTTAIKTMPTAAGQTLNLRYRTATSWLGLDLTYVSWNTTNYGAQYSYASKIRGVTDDWNKYEFLIKYGGTSYYASAFGSASNRQWPMRKTPLDYTTNGTNSANTNNYFAVRCVQE